MQAVTLFKVQPDGDKGDVELGTIEGYYADQYSHDRKGRIFLFANDGSRQSLYVYSICAGKLQKAIDLPEADRAVTSARFVGDGDTLLVATTDASAEPATNSRLEVYEQGRRISIADVSKESPLYASVAIIGVSPDGSVAYLREAGGDAGDVWGTYYRWDKTANSVRKLGDFEVIYEENASSGYLLDALNPSATLALRVHRANYAPDDLESPQSATPACIKKRAFDSGRYDSVGDEILVRDMSTQEERVVYRNLIGARNLCQNHLRLITAPRWRNDQTIVFSMPYGIYEIDVRSAKTRGIAFQDVALWNEGMRSSVGLVGANDEYLFTGRSSVVHIKTGREVSVPALRRDLDLRNDLRNFAVTTRFVIPTWTGGGVD